MASLHETSAAVMAGQASEPALSLSGTSSLSSCLTNNDAKSGQASPRASPEAVSEMNLDGICETNLEGYCSPNDGVPFLEQDVPAGELLPEGFDDSAVDAQLSAAEKWADMLDCTPEDILKFSYEDIAGPINQISLPEPNLVSAAFPDDPIQDNELGEVVDWETLSLPDIYDFCSTVPAPANHRLGSKRKAPRSLPKPEEEFVLGPIPMRARSKRARGGKVAWSAGVLSGLLQKGNGRRRHALDGGALADLEGVDQFIQTPTVSAGSNGTVVSTTSELSSGQVESALSGKGADDGTGGQGTPFTLSRRGNPFTETGALRRCSHCSTTKTPQWRAGPHGPKTLCNACGVRYKSGRLCAEYRPASSPEFEADKHSNSHRKIVEMRKMKEEGCEGVLPIAATPRPPLAHRRIKKTTSQPKVQLDIQDHVLDWKNEKDPQCLSGKEPQPISYQSSENGVTIPSPGIARFSPGFTHSDSSARTDQTQPVSKISVRVLTEKQGMDGSRLATPGANSSLIELGKQPVKNMLSEAVVERTTLKAEGAVFGSEAFEKVVWPANGAQKVCNGSLLAAEGAGTDGVGSENSEAKLVLSGTPVCKNGLALKPSTDAVVEGGPPSVHAGVPDEAGKVGLQAGPLTREPTQGQVQDLGPQVPAFCAKLLASPLPKLPKQQKLVKPQHEQKLHLQQKQQHQRMLLAQRQQAFKVQKPKQQSRQQKPGQQQHQVVQQQQHMVYFPPHTPMVYSPGLPQVPLMHHHHQPFPHMQQQLLLQQQHMPAQPLHPQQLLGNRSQQQQHQLPPLVGDVGKEDLPLAEATEKVTPVKEADAPVSPRPLLNVTSPMPSPVVDSAPKLEVASPCDDGASKMETGESVWEPARPPAVSPLNQHQTKPGGDQERLREQLRRRQEMGQSIRRQLDGVPAPVSASQPKGDAESDCAAELLPISRAFNQSSPKTAATKTVRMNPAQAASTTAVRKIGPHLFRRSPGPVKLQSSSVAPLLPQSALLTQEPKMEAPWEDLGSDRMFVRGSVGVEA